MFKKIGRTLLEKLKGGLHESGIMTLSLNSNYYLTLFPDRVRE